MFGFVPPVFHQLFSFHVCRGYVRDRPAESTTDILFRTESRVGLVITFSFTRAFDKTCKLVVSDSNLIMFAGK